MSSSNERFLAARVLELQQELDDLRRDHMNLRASWRYMADELKARDRLLPQPRFSLVGDTEQEVH